MTQFGPAGRTAPVEASCLAEPFRGPVSNSVVEGRVHFRHTDPRTSVSTEIWYAAAGDTGVFTRDAIISAVQSTVTPEASLCWSLPAAAYELTYLWGGWGQERQVATEALGPGRRVFASDRGRSTSVYSPWFALRNRTTGVRYAAQLAWSGNWEMGFERLPATGDKPIDAVPLQVWLGMRTSLGHEMKLDKRSFQLPTVAFTATTGDLDDAANNLHRYQRRVRDFRRSRPTRPLLVQFNSWYPFRASSTVTELKQPARRRGRAGRGGLRARLGLVQPQGLVARNSATTRPTRRLTPTASKNSPITSASRGMKFGIWVEIENAGHRNPSMFEEHAPTGVLQLNGKPHAARATAVPAELREARKCSEWARGVVDRLVRDYGIEWIKIDYNIDIGNRFRLAHWAGAGRSCARLLRLARRDPGRASEPGGRELLERRAAVRPRDHRAHAHHVAIGRGEADAIAATGVRLHARVSPEVCNHWMVGDEDSGKVDSSKVRAGGTSCSACR